MTDPTDEERCVAHRQLMEKMDTKKTISPEELKEELEVFCLCGAKHENEHIWITAKQFQQLRRGGNVDVMVCKMDTTGEKVLYRVYDEPFEEVTDPCDVDYMEEISS